MKDRKNIMRLVRAGALAAIGVLGMIPMTTVWAQGGRGRPAVRSPNSPRGTGPTSQGAFEKWRDMTKERDEALSGPEDSATAPGLRRQRREKGKGEGPGALDRKRKMRIGRLYRRYQALSDDERSQLRKSWQRFRGLPVEQRRAIAGKMKKWEALSARQRDILRQRRDQFVSMTPEQRQSLVEKGKRWFSLSPQERQVRREQSAQAPAPSDQQAQRVSPSRDLSGKTIRILLR